MSEVTEVVLAEIQDGVGGMALNRPDKFNCISTALLDGMDNGLKLEEKAAIALLGADATEGLNAFQARHQPNCG